MDGARECVVVWSNWSQPGASSAFTIIYVGTFVPGIGRSSIGSNNIGRSVFSIVYERFTDGGSNHGAVYSRVAPGISIFVSVGGPNPDGQCLKSGYPIHPIPITGK